MRLCGQCSLIFVVLICCLHHKAGAIELTNLRTMSIEDALVSNHKPHLLMFTQPDCKWCKKEAEALSELAEKCSQQVNITILGFKGTVIQLRREGRFYSPSIPFLRASKALLRQFKGVETSPSFVFLNQDSELLAKRVGYLQPSKLFNAVSLLTNNKCSLKSS